jgi:hypothetical protein
MNHQLVKGNPGHKSSKKRKFFVMKRSIEVLKYNSRLHAGNSAGMGRSTLELHPIAIFRRFSFPERAPRPAVAEVRKEGRLAEIYRVTGVGATLLGRD